jgi:hypothetical protein
VSDFLDQRRKEITDRLRELEPIVDEVRRLEAAAEALMGVIGSAASDAGSAAVATVTRRRGPGRPRGSSTAKKGPGRPKGSGKKVGRPAGTGKKVGRPPGSGKKAGRPASKVGSPTKARRGGRPKGGKRAAEALSFVQGQPGITIPELAAKMGIKQNYLYRVLPGLEQEGKLQKKDRGWYPKAV